MLVGTWRFEYAFHIPTKNLLTHYAALRPRKNFLFLIYLFFRMKERPLLPFQLNRSVVA